VPSAVASTTKTTLNAEANGTRIVRISSPGCTKGMSINVTQDGILCNRLIPSSRFKADMWAKIATEMTLPWRAAEAMHWQMGEHEMAHRAGVTAFSLSSNQPMPSGSLMRQLPRLQSLAERELLVGQNRTLR
jgi:hypothetical protein